MALMKIGIIGLGKMGEAIAYRAIQAGLSVIGYDVSTIAQENAQKIGVVLLSRIADFAQHDDIRVFWLMVPPGEPVDHVINELKPSLKEGNIIIDGGNSKFVDSMQRARILEMFNIFFMDCGTSGGIRARETGFCLMVGGKEHIFTFIEPLLKVIAMPNGYALLGPSGAGHYTKMVHNGIEYALLQSYAEGFHLLKEGVFKDAHLDLEKIASLWNHGSVIRSWILELIQEIMHEDQDFSSIKGYIAATGMGEWTVEQGHLSKVPVTLIEDALKIRLASQVKDDGNYATKLVSLLRNKFGGHAVTKNEEVE